MNKKINEFVGSRIKEIRKKKKLTQKELGEKLGVKHNTISSYEKGINEPEQDILFRMADVLDVSINDFFPYNEEINLSHSNDYTYFPTAISAGLPLEVDGITEASKITVSDEVLGKCKSDRNIFFVRANGNSMNKLFDDGALLEVKPINNNDDLSNDDIVVYSKDGEYSVKHFYKYGSTLVFKPNSTAKHKEHEYNAKEDNVQIHGKVVTYIVNVD